MKRLLLGLSALLVCVSSTMAQVSLPEDSVRLSDGSRNSGMPVYQDTLPRPKENFIKRFIRAFNETDTTYIQPNKYNWAVMLQNTNAFESYTIKDTRASQSITFSPKPGIKIGPYLGLALAFLWIYL